MPIMKPPDDWDCELHGLRLYRDELVGRDFEEIKRDLYEGEVRVEWWEGGAWQDLYRLPAWSVPAGIGIRVTGAETVSPQLPDKVIREPQPVRAARTRVWFPEGWWLFMDTMARGSNFMLPVYTKKPGTVLSECLEIPRECPEI